MVNIKEGMMFERFLQEEKEEERYKKIRCLGFGSFQEWKMNKEETLRLVCIRQRRKEEKRKMALQGYVVSAPRGKRFGRISN